MELRFTDGTTTIRILPTGGEAVLKRYTPQMPEIDPVDTGGATMDGGERPLAPYRNVSEQIDLVWEGDLAEQRAAINTLNRLFQQARHRQRTGMAARVYLEFRPGSTGDWWRSEILSGRVLVDDADLEFDLQLVNVALEAAIIYTRRFFWEGPEAQIPLTNGNGQNNTAGLTVVNHDDADAGDDNYVAIASTAISGDLPAPPRLEMTNSYDSATRASTIYVAHNAFSAPGTLAHILEAEDAAGGTPTEHATASAGYYSALSWEATTETLLLNWEISTEQLNALGGNYVRLLMRLYSNTIYTDLWLRVRIKYKSLTTLWEGPRMLAVPNQSLQDLGAVQLPPYLLGAGNIKELNLMLYGTRAQAGSHGLNVDFLQVAPCDGYRRLVPKGYHLEYQSRLIDDMVEGLLWKDTGADTAKVGIYVTYGAPILLEPGRDQRLYFLHSGWTGGAGIDRTLSVKAFYRPRRLTL